MVVLDGAGAAVRGGSQLSSPLGARPTPGLVLSGQNPSVGVAVKTEDELPHPRLLIAELDLILPPCLHPHTIPQNTN